jgi:hypothetical protein
MKKQLQKAIIKWYEQEHDSLSDYIVIDRCYEAFVVQVYIDELMFKGTNTPSVIKQLDKLRDFIEDNLSYIYSAVANVERMMVTSPYYTEYMNKTKFEKVVSVYNSYLELEKAVPGRGDETIQHFYNEISK